jgi:hypothetical protein
MRGGNGRPLQAKLDVADFDLGFTGFLDDVAEASRVEETY